MPGMLEDFGMLNRRMTLTEFEVRYGEKLRFLLGCSIEEKAEFCLTSLFLPLRNAAERSTIFSANKVPVEASRLE